MSYELGVIRTGRMIWRGPLRGDPRQLLRLRPRPRRLARRVFYDPALPYQDLGFSLRPPKWLRKAQPGVILKKAAPYIAAGAAIALVPGLAPMLAKGALAVGKGALVVGKAVPKFAGAIFKKILPTRPAGTPPTIPPDWQGPLPQDAPPWQGPVYQPPVPPAVLMPEAPPVQYLPPQMAPSQASMMPFVGPLPAEPAPGAAPSFTPLLIGAAVLGGVMLLSAGRRPR